MKAITQSDIAKAMGFSRNTVSRALNNGAGVSKEVRESILQKAFEMGYKASIPKQLTQEGNSIAFVSFHNAFNDSFWHPVLIGLESVIRKQGYSLTICPFNEEDSLKRIIPASVNSKSIAGIIMAGIYAQEYAQCFVNLNLPIVFIDCNVEIDIGNLIGDVIKMDNERSTYELTNYLIEDKGCRRLGFYGDVVACASYYERYQGFLKAMKKHNLEFDPQESLVFYTKGQYTSHKVALKKLQEIEYMPEAYVCCNDGKAIGLMMELKRMGYEIPRDIRIVGFDDQREASIVEPALTTIRCEREVLGRRAGEELLWRLNNPDMPYEIITLPTSLVIRKSSE